MAARPVKVPKRLYVICGPDGIESAGFDVYLRRKDADEDMQRYERALDHEQVVAYAPVRKGGRRAR